MWLGLSEPRPYHPQNLKQAYAVEKFVVVFKCPMSK